MAQPTAQGVRGRAYTIELARLDTAAGTAMIVTREALEPESATSAVKEIIKRMTAEQPPASRPPPDAGLSALRLERTMDCTYEMVLRIGLASKTRCTSTTTTPEANGTVVSQVDR